MYESLKYTELPDKKCQYSTKIFEAVLFELNKNKLCSVSWSWRSERSSNNKTNVQ